MCEKAKQLWTSLNKTIPVNQRELALGLAACTLAGIVLGMLLSPRNTVTLFSHNGNHTTMEQSQPAEEEDSVCAQS